MKKSWMVVAITFVILFIVTISILILNNNSFNSRINDLQKVVKTQKNVIKKCEFQKDSLINELDKYGWRTDLMFMCIGFANDTAEYPTIKIYNNQEKEIGQFQYVFNKSSKKIHLGDKFYLITTPKERQ
jgi:uncharacterized protein YxeA